MHTQVAVVNKECIKKLASFDISSHKIAISQNGDPIIHLQLQKRPKKVYDVKNKRKGPKKIEANVSNTYKIHQPIN